MSVSGAMVTACVLVLWGLRRRAAEWRVSSMSKLRLRFTGSAGALARTERGARIGFLLMLKASRFSAAGRGRPRSQ